MLWARVLAPILALATALSAALPPLHVHELAAGQGHHIVLEHRHVALHLPGVSAIPGHPQTFDHSDGPALTLDDHYTVASRFIVTFTACPLELLQQPTPGHTIRRSVEYTRRLIHGPPHRPESLRAPPAVVAL